MDKVRPYNKKKIPTGIPTTIIQHDGSAESTLQLFVRSTEIRIQNSDVKTKLPKEVEIAEKESEKKSQKFSTEHDQKTSLAQKLTDKSNVQLDSKFMPMYYTPMASRFMNKFI